MHKNIIISVLSVTSIVLAIFSFTQWQNNQSLQKYMLEDLKGKYKATQSQTENNSALNDFDYISSLEEQITDLKDKNLRCTNKVTELIMGPGTSPPRIGL